jgi:hypothetical protein
MKAGSLNNRLVKSITSGALLIAVLGMAQLTGAQTATSSSGTAAASTAAAGVAGATGGAGSASVSAETEKAPSPTIATPAPPSASPHLIAKSGPPIDEANRKTFEENAGKDAASILMRSSPVGAQIYINGDFVGNAPLLLSVAPGRYKIDMRDQRDGSAERTVGLLAKDRQTITLTLNSRYPNHVSIR